MEIIENGLSFAAANVYLKLIANMLLYVFVFVLFTLLPENRKICQLLLI